MYSKKEKNIIAAAAVSAAFIGATIPSGAMHIMEGYLQPIWAAGWSLLSFPFLMASFISVKKKISESRQYLILLLISAAFAIVMSSLKVPSITGSSSHLTGVGLGAILFGPGAMAIVSVAVLLFQALFAAHGGITTLGANVFSMGIAGPVVTYFSYQLFKKMNLRTEAAVILAVFSGNVLSYAVTSLQLALAHPTNGSVLTSLVQFLDIFAVTQVPLGIIEGLITMVIFNVVRKYHSVALVSLRVLSEPPQRLKAMDVK
jgi:cobalt/nickel transport system permease protein